MHAPPLTKRTFFTLSAVTQRIQKILQPAVGKTFWIKGEISSGRERGGNFFCDLVETDRGGNVVAKMTCVIWNRDLCTIRASFLEKGLSLQLDNGTLVGLRCSVQYSPQYGLSLRVFDADPAFALGELELRKREILERLEKEGLFIPNKRLSVPMLPNCIGIITSDGSAACNDFVQTLTVSPFGFKLFMADSIMQGNQTEYAILKAFSVFEKLNVELVVIIRGGGSKTDLAYLDNEKIARKIAAFKIPVWTGIGHEIDMSVLDHVANCCFKTPTAVAEEIVARYVEMKRYVHEGKCKFLSTWMYRLEKEKDLVSECVRGIRQGTRKLIDLRKNELWFRAKDLSYRVQQRLSSEKFDLGMAQQKLRSKPLERLREQAYMQKEMSRRLCSLSLRQLHEERVNLGMLCRCFKKERFIRRISMERDGLLAKQAILRAADPESILSKGFSLVYDSDGVLVKSIKTIKKDQVTRTRFHDGAFIGTVNNVEEKESGKRSKDDI